MCSFGFATNIVLRYYVHAADDECRLSEKRKLSMSFLISNIRGYKSPGNLRVLLDRAGIVVASDEPPLKVMTPMGSEVYCFGLLQFVNGAGGGRSFLVSPSAVLAERIDGSADPLRWTADIEGRFVIIVVKANGEAIVLTDRFGKRDVFLHTTTNGILMTSGMDLIPDRRSTGYDQVALAHTLTYYGHRPPKRATIYNSVRRLGVGEAITVNGASVVSTTRPFQPMVQARYGEAEHHLYADIFLDHLATCGSRAGNVVFLSSGWDSTSILAGLVHVHGRHKVRAVIARDLYSERSGVCNRFEIEKATKIADYYGIKLDTVDLDHAERGHYWSEQAEPILRDGHFFSLTGINHMILARHVAATTGGDETIFAGEISDGAHNLGFSQFVTAFHPSFEFRQYADKMASYLFGPTFAREFLSGRHKEDAVHKFFQGRTGATHFDTLADDPADRMQQIFASFFLRNGRMPLWSLRNVAMLTDIGRVRYNDEMTRNYLGEVKSIAPEQMYSAYLHLYNSFHWQGSTVATLQTMAEREGLRADLPFWDIRMQDFLASMPEKWGRGLDLNPTKFPLKWMLANRIDYPLDFQTGPHAYLYDVDPNFNQGVEIFYHSSLGQRMRELLRTAIS